jgi:hypothetical protein
MASVTEAPLTLPSPPGGRGLRRVGEAKPSPTWSWVRGVPPDRKLLWKAGSSPSFTLVEAGATGSFRRGPPGRMRGFDDHPQDPAAGKCGKGPFRPGEIEGLTDADIDRMIAEDPELVPPTQSLAPLLDMWDIRRSSGLPSRSCPRSSARRRGDLARSGARPRPDRSCPAGAAAGSRQAPRAGTPRPRRAAATGGMTTRLRDVWEHAHYEGGRMGCNPARTGKAGAGCRPQIKFQ